MNSLQSCAIKWQYCRTAWSAEARNIYCFLENWLLHSGNLYSSKRVKFSMTQCSRCKNAPSHSGINVWQGLTSSNADPCPLSSLPVDIATTSSTALLCLSKSLLTDSACVAYKPTNCACADESRSLYPV